MPSFRAAIKRSVINFSLTTFSLICISTAFSMTPEPAWAKDNNKNQSKAVTSTAEKKKETKAMNANQNPVVIMETSMGTIEIELNQKKAPITVKNFLKYVDDGFYNGTIFHRVISNFMIQGGGFSEDMLQKATGEQIKNEAKNGLSNATGTIAMARTNVVDSATSQFFINVKDNDFLNHRDDANYGYAVFGKVISGMETVEKIKRVPTTMKAGHQDVPATAVVINSVKRK